MPSAKAFFAFAKKPWEKSFASQNREFFWGNFFPSYSF